MCSILAAALLLTGCSAADSKNLAEPEPEPTPERRCSLFRDSTLAPTPPPLPSGGDVRLVHYNAYPYSDGFSSVVALRDGTAYAVGQRQFPTPNHPNGPCGPRRWSSIVLRWDGTSWQELPAPERVVEPRHVTATSDGHVWVFGICKDPSANGGWRGCVTHWDGTAWTASEFQDEGTEFAGVAAFARDDVWTGTYDTLEHWDGGRWQARRPPLHIGALEGTGSGTLWIAGEKDGHPALARWTGREWRSVPRPPIPRVYKDQGETLVRDIAVGDQGEVWVLGSMYWICGEEEMTCIRPVLMKWDGVRWTVKVMPERFSIGSIVSDGAGGLWATAPRNLAHFTGGEWENHPITRGPLGGRTVAQLARSPRASTIWAVGQDGTEDEKMPFSNGAIWKMDP